MRASEMRTTADELLKNLEGAKSGGFRDPNFVNIKKGEDEKWAKNVFRPIGNFQHAKIHYLIDYLKGVDKIGIPFVCPGSNICPSCQIAKHYYAIGDDGSKRVAYGFSAKDRHYWNVLPRDDEYEYGEDGKRFLVLDFGNGNKGTCIDSLMEIIEDHGNPADIDEGYDIIYMAKKKKNSIYGEYKFSASTERSRVGGRSGVFVTSKALIESELAFKVVDIKEYTVPIDDDQISLLDDILQAAVFGEGKKRRRETFSDDDSDDDDNDSGYEDDDQDDNDLSYEDDDDDDEDMLCFANTEVYDSEVAECTDCPSFIDCGKAVKKVKIAKARRRKSRG